MTSATPLRLWPGVVAAVLILVLRFLLPVFLPDEFAIGIFGAIAGAALVVMWWLFFSRAPWAERLGALLLMILAVVLIKPLIHRSISTGMMGNMFYVYAIPPVLAPAFVAWAVVTRHSSNLVRRISMVAAIFLACAIWTLFRIDGILGSAGAQLAWRWAETAEQRLLARESDDPKPVAADPPAPSAPAATTPSTGTPPAAAAAPATMPVSPAAGAAKPADDITKPAALPEARSGAVAVAPPLPEPEWPGFRGRHRDGVIRNVTIATDWSRSPPVAMWRRPVGPGWSSFAVQGDFFYTQEQRGEEEVVACYRVSTGEPVWRHRDPARFWESHGGAGPRGTPALRGGRVYAFGATGILNALDARTGARLWSRDVATDTGRKLPEWGFSSSPAIVDDLVIVAASGTLAGYDAGTGTPRWVGPRERGSYSSPHVVKVDGVTQVVLLTGSGAVGVAPATGQKLWSHQWLESGGTPIVQPAVTADGNILINAITSTGGVGIRRLAIERGSGGWTAQERWTSSGLKPYFNDLVVHEGHAFGFDGSILSCVDLADGARKWKGGRFGNGQLVLLSDQDLLLVVSEDGELALVSATADQFRQVARIPGIEGKTWNHPVVVGNVLLVRNAEEMAAFRLTPAGESAALHR